MLTTNTSSTNCRQIKIMKTRIFNYTTSFFLVTEAFTPIYLTHRSLTTRRLMSLISIPEAIAASKDDRNVFIDGSWYMPNTRNGREEFRVGPRVCGSRYFDIDNVWLVMGIAFSVFTLDRVQPFCSSCCGWYMHQFNTPLKKGIS